MEIPEGAKVPTDRKSAAIKPEEHPDGWSLLRPPIDLEYWEVTDFTSAVAEIRSRGDQVGLTSKNLIVIGKLVKMMQMDFAQDSGAFREWVRSHGTFVDATEKLLPLIYAYAGALGEAFSSEN